MKFWKEGGPGAQGSPWRFLERRFVVSALDKPGENRFIRYRIFQTPWFGLYVHRFDNADYRTFHDHPWSFVSIIVRGGYVEATPHNNALVVSAEPYTDYKIIRAGSINHKKATELHYIADLLRKPTWTIMLTGKRERVWGFVDENGWTRFDEYEFARDY